jgi:trans-aconitate 2-methyltransferase
VTLDEQADAISAFERDRERSGPGHHGARVSGPGTRRPTTRWPIRRRRGRARSSPAPTCSRGETVLDAGCGSGRVTKLLLEHGVRSRVDADARWSPRPARRCPPKSPVLHQDLLELELDEPVDVSSRCAVFHWITDHERLFANLHAALRPGGRLVAQCGGHGNLDHVLSVVATRPGTWLYATPEDTERRLRDAGFSQARAWLEPKETHVDDMEAFLATVVLHGDPDAQAKAAKAAPAARPPRLRATQHGGHRLTTIVTLPGDGIGPEIMDAALRVLAELAPDVQTEEHLFGGAAIDGAGSSLPDETLAACRASDGILLAAVGGPSGTPPTPRPTGPSAACSACARSSACSPTCARSGRSARCSTRARSSARCSRAPTCSSCAS